MSIDATTEPAKTTPRPATNNKRAENNVKATTIWYRYPLNDGGIIGDANNASQKTTTTPIEVRTIKNNDDDNNATSGK